MYVANVQKDGWKYQENTWFNGYVDNKIKTPYTTIVSMIAYGDGRSGESRTPGLMDPNHARYQLRYAKIIKKYLKA